MKSASRLLLTALLAITLAACANQKKEPVEVDTPPVQDRTDTPEVVTQALDANDYANSENFDNPDSMLYRGRRVIYFDFDQSTVRSEFRPVLRANGEYLAAHSGAKVTLEGHADERGSREYNLGLGERRGNAVRQILLSHGASANQIEVVSYGEERPTCRESSESCWSQNRRVEIVFNSTN